MTNIEFIDPPASRKGNHGPRIAVELAPLRERPGEWARVYGPLNKEWASVKASRINHGGYVGIATGEYEAITRKLEDGTYVWVRYVGPVG